MKLQILTKKTNVPKKERKKDVYLCCPCNICLANEREAKPPAGAHANIMCI
jgi:hypothetical protein